MTVNVDELVSTYVNIRTARDKLLKQFEEQDKEYKNDLDSIEAALLAVCNETQSDSIRTAHGTVMKKLHERYYGVDWDAFKDYVRAHDALDLFEKRIHQTNIKDLIAAHPGDGLPPGVNVFREYGVTVRKSNSVKDEEHG